MQSARTTTRHGVRRLLSIAVPALLAGVLLAAAGCGGADTKGDGDGDECVPGRIQSCSCPGGRSGSQTCQSDGTFGACSCGGTDAGVDAESSEPGRDSSTPPKRDSGSDTSDRPPEQTVELPIEVIGPDGYTESVEVDASDVESVESLYLRAYSIGYPQHYVDDRGYEVPKASTRLNGGDWVDITNEIANCEYPEKEMQCINGPMHTIRFELPVEELGNLQEGENEVEFRFNYPEPDERAEGAPPEPSTGYRILGMELRDGDDDDHIDGTAFEWDDPTRWKAPEGHRDDQSIQKGKELWQKRNHLDESWNRGEITASCADCHTKSGRDLEYFGFSNWSIVARSEFHGLSREQGRKIAAYIRSIELEDPDTGETYEPPGRPWHPPYQPGPTAVVSRDEGASRESGRGFDELSSQKWAAGAGVGWVLDRDKEMLPHLFPDGVDVGDIAPDKSLNVRQLPIALQYPDWNEWLPEVHPVDAYGDKFETAGDPGAWETYTEPNRKGGFEAIRSCMENQNSGKACASKVPGGMNWFTRKVNEHRDHLSSRDGTDYSWYDVDYSLMRWMAVKKWEILHKFDLMDEAREVYPDAAELQWPIPNRSVFNHASHILSGDLKGPKYEVHDPYFDTAWYDLQVVLNSGQGISTNQKPVDWKYHFAHIYERSKIDNWPQALRYVRSYVRILQNADRENTEQFHGDEHPEGWYLRHTQLGWMDRFPAQTLDDYRSGLKSDVLTAVAEAWYRGAIEGNDWESYPRNGGQYQIEPKSTVPSFIGHWAPSTSQNYADTTYSTVARLRDKGADPKVLDEYRDWGAKLWPKGNDSAAMGNDPTWNDLLNVP